MNAVNVMLERCGRAGPAAGQLDNVRQGEIELFAAGRVSFLLQRAAEHVSTSQAETHLRRFHYSTVSNPHVFHFNSPFTPSTYTFFQNFCFPLFFLFVLHRVHVVNEFLKIF